MAVYFKWTWQPNFIAIQVKNGFGSKFWKYKIQCSYFFLTFNLAESCSPEIQGDVGLQIVDVYDDLVRGTW